MNFKVVPVYFSLLAFTLSLGLFSCDEDQDLTPNPLNQDQNDTTGTDTTGTDTTGTDTTGGGADTLEIMIADIDSVNTVFTNPSFTESGVSYFISASTPEESIDFTFTSEPAVGSTLQFNDPMSNAVYFDVTQSKTFTASQGMFRYTLVTADRIEAEFNFIASDGSDNVTIANGIVRVNR